MDEQQSTTIENENLQEIKLSTLVDELEVLCVLIVDFNSLKRNGFDLSGDVATQGWEAFLNCLKWLVYPALVKDFYIHVKTTELVISSFVLGKKISNIEQSIAKMQGGRYKPYGRPWKFYWCSCWYSLQNKEENQEDPTLCGSGNHNGVSKGVFSNNFSSSLCIQAS